MGQAELINRCQQGDRHAMGLLYTSMRDELLAVCRYYVPDASTAEDLLHDSFLLIFSKIGQLQNPDKARSWMHAVVKNVALFYVEHHQQPLLSIDDVKETAKIEAPSDDAPTYEELMSYVDALPEGYRQVFRLSVLEGLSHQQIAALLNIEPHSSSSQLYRAKHLLRQNLRVLLLSVLALALPLGLGYLLLHHRDSHDPLLATTLDAAMSVDTVASEKPEGLASAQAGAEPLQGQPVKSALKGRQTALSPLRGSSRRDSTTGASPLPVVSSPLRGSSADTASVLLADATVDTFSISTPLPREEAETRPFASSDTFGISAPLPWGGVGGGPTSRLDLSLAYSDLPTLDRPTLPYSADGANGPVESIVHHRLPLTVGLDLSYRLSPRWMLLTGLHYTFLSSDFEEGNTSLYSDSCQHLHFVGFSLGAGYHLWERSAWSVYATASATLDLPLRGTTEVTYHQPPTLIDTEHLRLHPNAQWSVGAGLGFHYRLTPAIGLFAEPRLNYYFAPGDGLETWRTAHPVTFSVPVGVRVTLSKRK